ncbi:MAG: PD-(D/E)XK nuclease family protein [Dehalococcoidia bacterium]
MEAEPLRRVSPSLAEALRLCFLRVLLGRERRGQVAGGGPPARIGVAAHRVLAESAQGRFVGLSGVTFEQAFASSWDEAIGTEEAVMRAAGESHFGMLRHWRSYESVRALVRRAAREIALPGTERQFIEREFTAHGGVLYGRPDRVIWGQDGIVIEDFKTGAIYEIDEGEDVKLKASYRRQVLLYAAMVAAELGQWPERGRIVALSGEVEELAIDRAEASDTVAQAVDLLNSFNERLRQAKDPNELGEPSEQACSSCAYQAWCEPHWSAATPEWKAYVSIEGPVEVKQLSKNGLGALRISASRGTLVDGRYVAGQLDPLRFREINRAEPGIVVRLTKLRTHGTNFTAGWFTGIRVLP